MEHLGHYSIIILILVFTFFYKFRYQFSIKLVFIFLLIGLSFHNLFLHFDNTIVTLLSEKTHECCILPAAVTTPEVHIVVERVRQVSLLNVDDVRFYPEVITHYYSRPPPSTFS